MIKVLLISDPADSLRARRLAAHAAGPGVAVCRATPGAVPTQLARDVLRALGKRMDVADTPRQAERLWPRAATWMLAENVYELIVLRGHLLPADSITQLLGAMRDGTRLTLFVHNPKTPAELRQALLDADVFVRHAELDDYAPPPAAKATPQQPAQTRWPVLPRDDFLFFLHACGETLDGDQFDRVRGIVSAARHATDRWLDAHVAARGPAAQRPSRRRVLAFLEALTHCDDSEEALARLRGAQIALLFDDLLVDIDGGAFVAAHRAAGAAIARLDRDTVTLLRAFSSPVYAATGAIALAARAGAPALARLTMSQVADDGAEVSVDGRSVIVPEHAHALVRAQHITRRTHKAAAGDAFLTSPRAPDQPASVSALRTILKQIGQQTGLAMPSGEATPGSWWHQPAEAIHVHEL